VQPHRLFALLALVMPLACAAADPHVVCAQADDVAVVRAEKLCLAIRTYPAPSPEAASALLVFIHGDVSAGGPADYMYPLAQRFAVGGAAP